jgi:ubiquinone/menaquinone biosynthesis C-methylase UbiE
MSSYAEGFQSFLHYCNQRTNLYHWFKTSELFSHMSIKSILSIGAGTGEVEAELISNMNHPEDITIILIEPNDVLAAKICTNVPTEIIKSTYESYYNTLVLSGKRFDMIMLSHSIYYLDDPEIALKQCYDLLNEDGMLMVINESIYGIHDFRKRYGNHEDMLFSDQDVEKILPGPKVLHRKHVIDGHIETRYLQTMLPFILPKVDNLAIIKAEVLEYAQQAYGDYIYQPSVVLTAIKVTPASDTLRLQLHIENFHSQEYAHMIKALHIRP